MHPSYTHQLFFPRTMFPIQRTPFRCVAFQIRHSALRDSWRVLGIRCNRFSQDDTQLAEVQTQWVNRVFESLLFLILAQRRFAHVSSLLLLFLSSDTAANGRGSDAPVAVCQSHHVREDRLWITASSPLTSPSKRLENCQGSQSPTKTFWLPDNRLGTAGLGCWVEYSTRAASFTEKVGSRLNTYHDAFAGARNSRSIWKCIPPIWPLIITKSAVSTQGVQVIGLFLEHFGRLIR